MALECVENRSCVTSMGEGESMCVDGGEGEPRMGAAMALAVASRTGLLHAMFKDDDPKAVEEWAALTRAPKRSTEETIMALVGVQVVERLQEEEVVGRERFHIPANRASAVKEMGAIFEALLLGKKLDETTLSLIKFRCEKMLSVSTCA